VQQEDGWQGVTEILYDAAQRIQQGGAECVLICTNTMHKMAEEIQKAVSIPLLHIADPTARRIKERGIRKIALLGTRTTMEEDFYKGRLAGKYGLEVMIPAEMDRNIIHKVIYDELCLGKIVADSGREFIRIIEDLGERGAEGIILGCTEISLLVKDEDSPVPLFDTTAIHARAAVDFAMGE
jgi:aspartate racemase